MQRTRETLLYSAGGIIALFAIVVAINFIISTFNARVDLTQGNVYTLSPGTKAILSKLEAPVRIRFYYTKYDKDPWYYKMGELPADSTTGRPIVYDRGN